MIIGQHEFKKMLNDKRYVEVKYARIAEGYTSGRPTLVFDGETTATLKQYPYLSSYTPVSGDRVQVVDGVIHGKIM